MEEEELNQIIDSYLEEYNFSSVFGQMDQLIDISKNRIDKNAEEYPNSHLLIELFCEQANYPIDEYPLSDKDKVIQLMNDKSLRSFYSKCIVLYFLIDSFNMMPNFQIGNVYDFGVITLIPSKIISFVYSCYQIDNRIFSPNDISNLFINAVSPEIKFNIIDNLVEFKMFTAALQYYYFSGFQCQDISQLKVIIRLFTSNGKYFECLKFIRSLTFVDIKDSLFIMFKEAVANDQLDEFSSLVFGKEEEIVDNFEFPTLEQKNKYYRIRRNFAAFEADAIDS
ncbi:hypothetical protein GPJ56_010264 [Histomonas meleagridis]|uniref:uncharacterized protein n=1 Tax=Histomonas meleagridis TaxID=135588 RepID=UPI00355A2D86|nr:hypothetical protein GPJ56_010264 [Histomonas meleagridis]KAH0797132.1 hypothetical protein GO595_011025 [Histomonas meleagridis]